MLAETARQTAQEDGLRFETELNGKDMSNTVVYNTFFKRRWLLPYIVALGLISGFFVFSYYGGFFQIPFLLVIAAIGVLFVILFSYIAAKLVGRGQTETKKRYYTVNANGIATTLENGEKPYLHPWKELYEARETGQYLFIYLNAADVLILPKRCFGQGDLETLRALIRAHMGAKRHRLKKH